MRERERVGTHTLIHTHTHTVCRRGVLMRLETHFFSSVSMLKMNRLIFASLLLAAVAVSGQDAPEFAGPQFAFKCPGKYPEFSFSR